MREIRHIFSLILILLCSYSSAQKELTITLRGCCEMNCDFTLLFSYYKSGKENVDTLIKSKNFLETRFQYIFGCSYPFKVKYPKKNDGVNIKVISSCGLKSISQYDFLKNNTEINIYPDSSKFSTLIFQKK